MQVAGIAWILHFAQDDNAVGFLLWYSEPSVVYSFEIDTADCSYA